MTHLSICLYIKKSQAISVTFTNMEQNKCAIRFETHVLVLGESDALSHLVSAKNCTTLYLISPLESNTLM